MPDRAVPAALMALVAAGAEAMRDLPSAAAGSDPWSTAVPDSPVDAVYR
ncbi:hypothetical protein [Glycomyces paridis]|nr:hypothetical protein [Glycomyces paridis]